SSDWFLKDFARDERYYNLGPYASLQETIDYFKASLGYRSYAALRGATASTVLSPLWADPQACQNNEAPLACEYRVHNPAFVFIALGTNDIHKVEQFEPNMRLIIEYTLQQGIVPILVTKADNLEGDDRINNTIARLAVEYHLPVWNFWAAVQPLPGHGLQGDGAHLTFRSNFFDDPEKLKGAWAVRNLTALQVLEAMRTAVQEK
ncbi:MAG TPA: SGNH/GDSL hydrolase family protein, partial [Anaerolineales bacterium]|nr:SGNH/GDSL hydrolase family protein [Anaerolineales bacterium]